MFFSNQYVTCPNCGKKYDFYLEDCPNCKSTNNLRPDAKKCKNMDWISFTRQILLICVGYASLKLSSLIISLIITFTVSFNITSSNPNLSQDSILELVNSELSLPKYNMIVNGVSYALTLILILIIVFPYLKNFLRKFKNYRNLLGGIFGFALLIAFSYLYTIFLNFVYPTTGNDNQGAIVQLANALPWSSFLIFGIVGPIVEEFIYRVGLFNALSRLKQRWLAYLITALVFGFIHFNFTSSDLVNELANIPSYIISGLIFCYIYEKYSFAGSLIAHILNNCIALIITFLP